MIKSIILRDFFSFKGETTVELNSGINILLGINGSGKTSFLNALRLLFEGISGNGVASLLQEKWGGFDQIVNINGERKAPYAQVTYEFDHNYLNKINPAAGFKSDVYYRITINRSGNSYLLSEKVYAEKNNDKKDFIYLDFTNGQGKLSSRTSKGKIEFLDYGGEDFSGQELVLRQINDPFHYLPTHTLRKAIESIAVYNGFNTSEAGNIRTPGDYYNDVRLRSSGINLTQMLTLLKLNHQYDFDRLEKRFQEVNPNYKSIEISNVYGQSVLSLIEKNMSRAIQPAHISDGTLRFLLIECIFCNSMRGDLVALDEPERGLHPDMISSVAEMMKQAAKETQIIVATHSPHLLNQFEIEDILVFEKNDENSTEIHRYSEDDFEDMETEILPGQLWLLGQIGGKRW